MLAIYMQATNIGTVLHIPVKSAEVSDGNYNNSPAQYLSISTLCRALSIRPLREML